MVQRDETGAPALSQWDPADFAAVPVDGPGLHGLQRALLHTHVNGEPLCGRVQVLAGGASAPSAQRGSGSHDGLQGWLGEADEILGQGLLAAYVRCDALREAMPELFMPKEREGPDAWHPVPAAAVPQLWAQILVTGGVYERFPGTPRQALELCRVAWRELAERRTEEFLVFTTNEPWTTHFFGLSPGLDSSWLLIDRRKRTLTLLCITDVD